MEKRTPAWLDANFLTAALQGGKDKEPRVSVVSFEVTSVVEVNYSSDIFRVQVRYTVGGQANEQSKSLVIKVPDEAGLVYSVVGPSICEKEYVCYNELLAKMMDKVKCTFAPVPFYSPVDNVVVMEDLKPQYILADKHKQLDLAHCKLVVTKMAKYHASSVAVYHENPDMIKFVGREGFFPEGGTLRNWVEVGTKTLGECLKKSDVYKEYADFFLSRVDTIWESLVNSIKMRPGRFNVLNHGDLWTNNMLFKYDDSQNVVDVKFIDYQVSRYTTPAADLVYFIYGSAEHEVRENNQQDLLSLYLEVLNSSLQQLGCAERLSAEQLKEDIKSSIPWFIGVTAWAYPLIFAGGTKDGQTFEGVTTEDFASGKANNVIAKLVSGDVLTSRIPHMVRQFLALIES